MSGDELEAGSGDEEGGEGEGGEDSGEEADSEGDSEEEEDEEDDDIDEVLGLHKILFHFNAVLWESIILLLPPATCKAYPIVLHYCTTITQYTPPLPTPPFYAIHHTILVMAISCEGL